MSPNPRNRPFAFADQDIVRIAQAFQNAGFDETGLIAALGVKGIAAIKDVPAEAAYRRTGADLNLNTLIRLFVIGAPALPAAVRKAFDGMSTETLMAGGLRLPRLPGREDQ